VDPSPCIITKLYSTLVVCFLLNIRPEDGGRGSVGPGEKGQADRVWES
jgi:hypothetical protein